MGNLYYWREGDYEVDFIWELNARTYAIEVKSGRRKNSTSLGKFLKKHPNAIPVIVNQDNFLDFLSRKKDFFMDLS